MAPRKLVPDPFLFWLLFFLDPSYTQTRGPMLWTTRASDSLCYFRYMTLASCRSLLVHVFVFWLIAGSFRNAWIGSRLEELSFHNVPWSCECSHRCGNLANNPLPEPSFWDLHGRNMSMLILMAQWTNCWTLHKGIYLSSFFYNWRLKSWPAVLVPLNRRIWSLISWCFKVPTPNYHIWYSWFQ